MTPGPAPERRAAEAGPELAGLRLDLALVQLWPDLTRARLQRLLEQGEAQVDGRPAKPSLKLRGGERLTVTLAPPPPSTVQAEDLPLSVLHEDAEVLVLDKAPGMVVHPARGAPSGTVVNAVLHHLGGKAAGARTALVHRLDKDTSGCLLLAKTDAALATLQAAFKARTVEKTYLAVCHGVPEAEGRLDTMYGRHPGDRTRFTSRGEHTRRAVTGWRVLERFGGRAALVEVALETGRTHQIRVHLAEAGHPLLGDATYGGRKREARLPEGDPVRRAAALIGRQALHAWRLAFDHPRRKRRLELTAPLPADLEAGLALLRRELPAAPPAG